MAKILAETPDVLEDDATDVVMTEAEEREIRNRFSPPPTGGMRGNDIDLSDGGYYGVAKITPMVNGQPSSQGRAAARKAWTWNGSETVMALAWNPDGTIHDGGRRYLAKRVCLCCHTAGFRVTARFGNRCPQCVHTNCRACNASTDTTKVWQFDNGKTFKGWIIPCNYLKYEQVPFQNRPYGDIDCFLPMCTRRGARGFKTEEDMRLHGTMIHSAEYRVWMEAKQARKADDVERLQNTVNELMAKLAMQGMQPGVPVTESGIPVLSGHLLEIMKNDPAFAEYLKAKAATPMVESVRPRLSDEQRERRNEALRKARAARAEKLKGGYDPVASTKE